MSWSPAYATVEDLAAWLRADPNDEIEAAEMTLALEAASRAIDRATSRQFGLVAAPEARYYTAHFHRDLRRWYFDVDDLMTTTGLVVNVDNDGDATYEGTVTDYDLSPPNAAAEIRPWTRIEVRPTSTVSPRGQHRGVKVTGRWGWTEIPEAIKFATIVQASRLFARRDALVGPLTSKQVDDVEYQWGGRPDGLDADVMSSLAPFRRTWSAV